VHVLYFVAAPSQHTYVGAMMVGWWDDISPVSNSAPTAKRRPSTLQIVEAYAGTDIFLEWALFTMIGGVAQMQGTYQIALRAIVPLHLCWDDRSLGNGLLFSQVPLVKSSAGFYIAGNERSCNAV